VVVYTLLLPGYSLLALAGCVEVLHALNRQANRPLVRVVPVSATPLATAGGIDIANGVGYATFATAVDTTRDLLLVVSDAPLPEEGLLDAVELLRTHSHMPVGGIGTGTWLMARAGLLDGQRATIDWPYSTMFADEFPRVVVSNSVLEISAMRLSAAAGTASVDLTLAWVTQHFGDAQAAEIAEQLGYERRAAHQPQRVPLAARIGGGQPKLTEAVTLMETNIAEPLPTEEIARLVGVSRRQLERLFKQYLQSLPSRYYLEMRLARSRALLTQTSQSILQIGLTCGFSSGPHFSSAYRNHFGLTPREERSKRLPGAYRADTRAEEA
jgi:transcriptional regulator GlxA family with amidase domain